MISNDKISYQNYLLKIKKINLKIYYNEIINVFISNIIKKNYEKLAKLLLSTIKNYKLIDSLNIDTDIVLFNEFDRLELNEISLNICINGENRECQKLTDIGIITTKIFNNNFNIYLPFLFCSLWERKTDYKKILTNTKEKFCAYMYSNDVQYRIDLFNKLSTYKHIDALGKSCYNITDDFDPNERYIFNDNSTYNDIAVQKYSKYKFVLALENSIGDGYITEKLINPLLANSIPIYAGPKDVFNIINKKRIIYVYDFNNIDLLIEYIHLIDNSDILYDMMVSQEIFCGDLNWNTFEHHLQEKLIEGMGLKSNDYAKLNIDNEINKIINYNKNVEKLTNTNDKITYISHIAWINLDKSIERRNNMEKQLEYIPIKNTRISAIDGDCDCDDIKNLINVNTDNLTNCEVACCLSHIKTIYYLSKLEGEYFLILEDDTSFDNIYLIDTNLKNIIENAPQFDILILNKIYFYELENMYTSWNEMTMKNKKENELWGDYTIWGTGSYIISKNGIKNIINMISYIDNEFYLNYGKFHISDYFLYANTNTYVYKYNYFNPIDKDSFIHPNHLDYQIKSTQFQKNIIVKDFYNSILNNNIKLTNNIELTNIKNNIFGTNNIKTFYSQLGEDLYIYKNFINKKINDGIYIELGAMNGITYSNSKFFEDELGFQGILIEPTKQYNELIINRPKNKCFNYAINYNNSNITFIGDNATSGILEKIPEILFNRYHKNNIPYEVKGCPIKDIISKTNIKYIDIFFIDVEGSELIVLETMDWTIEIYIIIIEMHNIDIENENKCRQVLINNGFEYHNKIICNEIWINNNYTRINKLFNDNIKLNDNNYNTIYDYGNFPFIEQCHILDIFKQIQN